MKRTLERAWHWILPESCIAPRIVVGCPQVGSIRRPAARGSFALNRYRFWSMRRQCWVHPAPPPQKPLGIPLGWVVPPL